MKLLPILLLLLASCSVSNNIGKVAGYLKEKGIVTSERADGYVKITAKLSNVWTLDEIAKVCPSAFIQINFVSGDITCFANCNEAELIKLAGKNAKIIQGLIGK